MKRWKFQVYEREEACDFQSVTKAQKGLHTHHMIVFMAVK